MHFSKSEGFDKVAKAAGGENTPEYYLKTAKENNVIMSVAMGNARDEQSLFGGSTPRVPDLAGKFDYKNYNQPKEIAYCAGVDSKNITMENAEATAQEFRRYLETPQCVGIKIYLGYNSVYAADPRHYPLYRLAEEFDVRIVYHTGDLAGGHGMLKYAHPLTVDEVAKEFPKVRFVMSHCGNPWLLDAIEVAASNENVYLDLSGLLEGNFAGDVVYDKHKDYFSYIKMWLNYIDRYDKVLYGTDWPLINMKSYIEIMQQVIPADHAQEFFYDNAVKVYSKLTKLLPR